MRIWSVLYTGMEHRWAFEENDAAKHERVLKVAWLLYHIRNLLSVNYNDKMITHPIASSALNF